MCTRVTSLSVYIRQRSARPVRFYNTFPPPCSVQSRYDSALWWIPISPCVRAKYTAERGKYKVTSGTIRNSRALYFF